jgi:hypothetical protein
MARAPSRKSNRAMTIHRRLIWVSVTPATTSTRRSRGNGCSEINSVANFYQDCSRQGQPARARSAWRNIFR